MKNKNFIKYLLPSLVRISLVLLAMAIFTQPLLSQKDLWKTLAKVTYKKEMDEFLGFKIDKPVFSQQVKELEGKEVTVKGFIIPVEGYKGHTEFVFSAYPYSMCFFCGGAGPETVMEVKSKEPVEYTAESIILKGRLHLNGEDINNLMYRLEDAEKVDGFNQ